MINIEQKYQEALKVRLIFGNLAHIKAKYLFKNIAKLEEAKQKLKSKISIDRKAKEIELNKRNVIFQLLKE